MNKKVLISSLLLIILSSCTDEGVITTIISEEQKEDFVCNATEFRKKEFAITSGRPTMLFNSVGQITCNNIICSAVLIGEKTVITAKHCVPMTTTHCNFNLGLINKSYYGEIIKYKGLIDLAILKLEEPVMQIKPRLISGIKPKIDDDVIYIGFGMIEEAGPGLGQKRYGCSKIISWTGGIIINTIGGSEVCNGDSGGAVLINGYLAGIISHKAAECGVGSGSVAIYPFIEWILDNSQDRTIKIGE